MGANKRLRDIPRHALVFVPTDTTKNFIIKGGVGPPSYSVSPGKAVVTLIEIPNWANTVATEFKVADPNGNTMYVKSSLTQNQISPPALLKDREAGETNDADYPIFEGCVVTLTLAGAPGGTALAIGSPTTTVANGAFNFNIAGTGYSKGAAAGTALAVGTIPQNKWGIYRFSIVAAGTITVTPGSANGTGYDSEALAIAALSALPASSADMGYVTVMSTVSGGFVEGTSNLNDGGVTAHYYPIGGTAYVTIYYK